MSDQYISSEKEIARALNTWFRPGDVFEIRALDVASDSYKRTESGYFDFEHIDAAVKAASSIRDCTGVYVTLNPVRNSLLDRSPNKIRKIFNEKTTDNYDIRIRKWLLIDCVSIRDIGLSATDEEHAAALRKAEKIRDYLTSLGWPLPIMLDSGNGAQMTYSIEFPPDDDGIVKDAIINIAQQSDEQVFIDVSAGNPACILRIPGTWNREDDVAPGRPCRMVRILSIPEKIGTVSSDLLRRLAGIPSEDGDDPEIYVKPDFFRESSDFQIDSWLARHIPDAPVPLPFEGGRKWVLKVCPFHPEHNSKSAVITESADGSLGFRCHCEECAGNNWLKLREILESERYHECPQDSCALTTVNDADPLPISDENVPLLSELPVIPEKYGNAPIVAPPEHLLHIPGFIDDFVTWSMASAPHPNRVLSFCGALAFLSYTVGRRIISDRNTLPNIYLIALADSGTGKDHPRKANLTAAVESGIGEGVVEDFTSGGSIEDSLYIRPNILYQKDEFDTLLKVIKMAKDPHSETQLAKLLSIYGASNSFWKLRRKVVDRSELMKIHKAELQGESVNKDLIIKNPYLVIYGTAIPQFFYESLSSRLLCNGLGARCIILSAGDRSPVNRSKCLVMPDSIKNDIATMLSYGSSAGCDSIHPGMDVLATTPEADAALDQAGAKYDELYRQCQRSGNTVAKAFWSRAMEKVIKLSMLYAVSESVNCPKLSSQAVKWAENFVTFTTKQTLDLADEYSYENPFDEKCRRIVRYLRESAGACTHSLLLKRSHESKEVFEKIIRTLLESKTVSEAFVGKGRDCRKVYMLKDIPVIN